MPPTILDVIDNFFDSREGPERQIASMSGVAVHELGGEVRRFAHEYAPARPDQATTPIYLGGWPSANISNGQGGQLALTSLLYSGQILGKDPLSDWYSIEQYSIPAKMAARPGYLDPDTGEPNTLQTRSFLKRVVPALQRLRPLIQHGHLVLAPSKPLIKRKLNAIEQTAKLITARIGGNPKTLAARFSPADLAMEDNVRGMMVFSGGNRETQIRKQVEDAARYFAAEYALANEHGFTYAAPFEFEAFLCMDGLSAVLSDATGARIVNALLKSRLPIFEGLTPEVVASLRDDEAFGQFRSALFDTYRHISTVARDEDVDHEIRIAEDSRIAPVLATIQKELDRGLLGRLGAGVGRGIVSFAAGIVTGNLTGLPPLANLMTAGVAGAATILQDLMDKRRFDPAGPGGAIWSKLYEHGRTVAVELPSAEVKESTADQAEFWGIPEHPSRSVHVTSGIILPDWIPELVDSQEQGPVGGASNPYGLCSCRSGQKWKFCCKDVPTRRTEDH